MNKNSGFNYFLTPFGRNLVVFAAGGTTCGLYLANFLPHTFGLKYYIDFIRAYQNGLPRPVSKNVLERLNRAMDILELNDVERKTIQPFTVFGFDLFQAGSTNYHWGAAIGIPINYSYNTIDEIAFNEIRFREKAINWETESGKLLKESIILTQEEQIFGLCKTILQLRTQKVLLYSIYPSASFLLVYTIGGYLNRKFKLLNAPFSLRCVMYGILSLLGFGSWCCLKDMTQVFYDKRIDNKLAALGPEFVTAGITFYDKILKKNQALRALLGNNTYTVLGNENYLLRYKSLPITMRKEFFENKSNGIKLTE